MRLKPKVSQSGVVDGAWWPHSDDLAAELPDLLAVLSVRLGRIDRVMYNVDEWAKSSRKLATCGLRVRLDGSRRQSTNTIEVVGIDRHKTILLVVPPNTDPDKAHASLMAAAAPGDGSTVDSLLMVSARERKIRTQVAGAQERWRSERLRSVADPAT